MEEDCVPALFKVFYPAGRSLYECNPWQSQADLMQPSQHDWAAWTMGESQLLKGFLNPSTLQGSETHEDDDQDYIAYSISPDLEKFGAIEEFYVKKGTCLVSEGFFSQKQSVIRGMFRPQVSYGTGFGIKTVLRAYFGADGIEGEKKRYICLVEEHGITLYEENSANDHVAYIPEFQIDQVFATSFGLLIVPIDELSEPDETNDDKYIYALTHPIKQVSRLYTKSHKDAEYTEYENINETLILCKDDICVFWSNTNDKIIVRKLAQIEKSEIEHLSTLNASSAYTTAHDNLTGSSSMFSPLGKMPTRSAAMRNRRETSASCHWPSFEFSDSTNPGVAVGFYPPYMCVYDEPELSFNPFYEIDLLSMPNNWIKPSKCELMYRPSNPSIHGLWILMNTHLYLFTIDTESGKRVNTYALVEIEDFITTGSKEDFSVVITTSVDGVLKKSWLNENFSIVVSSKIEHGFAIPFKELKGFFFNDTLVCRFLIVDDDEDEPSDAEETGTTEKENSTEKEAKDEDILNPDMFAYVTFHDYRNYSNIKSYIDRFSRILPMELMICIISSFGNCNTEEFQSEKRELKKEMAEAAQARRWRRLMDKMAEEEMKEIYAKYYPKSKKKEESKIEEELMTEDESDSETEWETDEEEETESSELDSSEDESGSDAEWDDTRFANSLKSFVIGGKEKNKTNKKESNDAWSMFLAVVKKEMTEALKDNAEILKNIIECYKDVKAMSEEEKVMGSVSNDNLDVLANTIKNCIIAVYPSESIPVRPSVFEEFCLLLRKLEPQTDPSYENLPELMKILLTAPDSLESLKRLDEIKKEFYYFAPAMDIMIADVFYRARSKVKFHWPESLIRRLGRTDYLSGTNDDLYQQQKKEALQSVMLNNKAKKESESESKWTHHVLKMRVFSEDRRLEEVCHLLDSASPLTVDIEQRAEMSDHEFVEEQEKQLLQLIQISFSAPVGRAAFQLKTEEKNFANVTYVIKIPRLCQTGKCASRGTTIELNDTDLPTAYCAWPNFHNAVAAALAVRFVDTPAEAWFGYNKAKTSEGPQQAGVIFGFGLSGILKNMPPALKHEYLAKENSFTTMAMLLGLSANLTGTGDMSTWKIISLHIGAMLPACTTELEVPRLATVVAPCALGLLFLGTHNTHIAKVLLGEIAKRYNPLSIFSGNGANTSSNAAADSSTSTSAADRESHSLCSGFGLGFVNLGKGRTSGDALQDDDFNGILRRFVVGGPKPSNLLGAGDDDPGMNHLGQSVPSLWEEYRCCHIEEGDNVNVDVTTPSAIVAVSLIYLKSGNEAVLKWLAPPTTLHLLDGVRPDLLLLRSLASILVLATIEVPSVAWLEEHLMPQSLQKVALKTPNEDMKIDFESMNQAWVSIVCGYCLGLGIRFAGTSDARVKKTLFHYSNQLIELCSPDSQFNDFFPKNFLESAICTVTMSMALLLAGTGSVSVLRLCRYLQAKVGTAPITSASNTYGLQMCVSLATGILFLGGGRYSLCNDDRSIAVLLAAVFPKWPVNANDNRYHLQALRHLYVLAAQPRLILPKPMPHNSKIKCVLTYIDGTVSKVPAPVLLPPFNLLKSIALQDPEYFSVVINLPDDVAYLTKIVENGGSIDIVRKPIGLVTNNFSKKMAWRVENAFKRPERCPKDEPLDSEALIMEEISFIERTAKYYGVENIVAPLLTLIQANSKSIEWTWQVRSLIWWTSICTNHERSTVPPEFLTILLNKAGDDFKVFPVGLFPSA